MLKNLNFRILLMNFKVFRTEMFEEELEKLPKAEQERIKKI